jgi:hypothetical protein
MAIKETARRFIIQDEHQTILSHIVAVFGDIGMRFGRQREDFR